MNTHNIDTITPIEIELIDTTEFPQQKVLCVDEEIEHTLYEAQRAIKLGNLFNDKVKILFEDKEGMKLVETRIWGMTDDHLILKRGIKLPLHQVHEIII